MFRCFRDGFDGFAGHWLGPDGLAQSVWIAIPLIALIGTSLLLKFRLPLAIASHLSLLYSACLIYDIGAPSESAVMPGFSLGLLWAPSNLVAMTIFLGSLLSSAMSHWIYWRDILLNARNADALVSYLPQPTL